MSRVWKLGPEHRDRIWRDEAWWTFAWSGDTFWHIYRPDGTLADDMIEEALNEKYANSPYGPFIMINKVDASPEAALRPAVNITEAKPGSLQEIARELYEAWRGGKADWSKLTPENKARWYRAAIKATEACRKDGPPQDILGDLQELQRAGLLGRSLRGKLLTTGNGRNQLTQ